MTTEPAPPMAAAPLRTLSIFNRYLERGGEEAAVEAIAGALESRPDLFAHRGLTFSSGEWKRAGGPSAAQQARLMWRNPDALARLRTEQATSAAQCWITHNVFPVGSAALYEEARRAGIPVVQFVHNFRPFSISGYAWDGRKVLPGSRLSVFAREIATGAWQGSRVKTAWFGGILEAMHRRGGWQNVRSWVAISEFMRQHFIAMGIPEERIFTLHHFYEPTVRPIAPPPERYCIFLGRLITAKGVQTLIEAWTILEDRYGLDIPELRIAGDGPLTEWVVDQARRLRRVRYLGWIGGEEKERQLAGGLALLAPSVWWEPFGLVAYEAYDYRKPVLAARSGGLTELVAENETGWLHTPGDAAQLAEQVMALDANPERAVAVGERGRSWLESHARRDRWVEDFHRIVGQSLASPEAGSGRK